VDEGGSQLTTLETGAPYMVMEFLEGGDLAAWVQQRGAMPQKHVAQLVVTAEDGATVFVDDKAAGQGRCEGPLDPGPRSASRTRASVRDADRCAWSSQSSFPLARARRR